MRKVSTYNELKTWFNIRQLSCYYQKWLDVGEKMFERFLEKEYDEAIVQQDGSIELYKNGSKIDVITEGVLANPSQFAKEIESITITGSTYTEKYTEEYQKYRAEQERIAAACVTLATTYSSSSGGGDSGGSSGNNNNNNNH